jgi:O-antigen/teichoic acid export membrane protein
MPAGQGVDWLLRWVRRLASAVADQGLFSAANFVLNVALARWLVPDQYGTFTMIYATLILLASFHAALLDSPMLVLGAGRYGQQFGRYVRIVLRGHWCVSGILSLLVGAAALVAWWLGSTGLTEALLGLAVALPTILLYWLLRRAFYVHLRPHWAAAGSALYLPLVLASIYVLRTQRLLSPLSVVLAMALASLIASLVLLRLLARTPEWSDSRRGTNRPSAAGESGLAWTARGVMRDHWTYGRWLLATALVGWLGSNVHYLFLSTTTRLDEVARMRAMDTLLMPFFICLGASSRLVLPVLARTASRSAAGLGPTTVRLSAVWAFQAIVVAGTFALAGSTIVSLLYGRSFPEIGEILPWYSLYLIPESVIDVMLGAFRAIKRTYMDLVQSLIIVLGVPMGTLVIGRVDAWGVASVRVVVSSFVFVVFALHLWRVLARGSRAVVHAGASP